MTTPQPVPDTSALDDASDDINSKAAFPAERHAEAGFILTHAPGVQDRAGGTVQDMVRGSLGVVHGLDTLPGLTQRDSAVVYLLVLFRLLAHGHLNELAFPHRNSSVVRRCADRMSRQGWVTQWDAAKERGGRERYLHPTAKALAWAFAQSAARTQSEPWARLVRLMQPDRRAPLALAPGARPKWLAHQREVNSLVVRTLIFGPHPVVWASTWDSPFPPSSGLLKLPQPDYVLVEQRHGAPHLVFGEHDRGTERLETFIARKVELYAGLAMFPEVCEQLFGLRSFEVRVSAIDIRTRNPIARLRALAAAAAATPAPMTFTLAGWLHAVPDRAVWFSRDSMPATDSVRLEDHALTASSSSSSSA